MFDCFYQVQDCIDEEFSMLAAKGSGALASGNKNYRHDT